MMFSVQTPCRVHDAPMIMCPLTPRVENLLTAAASPPPNAPQKGGRWGRRRLACLSSDDAGRAPSTSIVAATRARCHRAPVSHVLPPPHSHLRSVIFQSYSRRVCYAPSWPATPSPVFQMHKILCRLCLHVGVRWCIFEAVRNFV